MVEYFYVVKDVATCLFAIVVGATSSPLPLEQPDDALGDDVVVAIAAPTYARYKVVRSQEGLPVVTAAQRGLVREKRESCRLRPREAGLQVTGTLPPD